MTDAAEQPTNNINFVTGGMYYLHDLVDTVVRFLEKVLVHSPTEIVMEKSCMWPPIPLVVIVTGFGKTCIVHTSNFSTLETHKIYLERQTDVKLSGIVELLFLYHS